MQNDPHFDALERALGAHYEIIHLLGRGGMGAVYLGRERALDRHVAIKVLPIELADDADSRERFRREARTAARLSHPNIVPLYAFGDAEGMLYFVMGYVRGESLGTRLRRDGKVTPDDVRRILGALADALHCAHRHGVVHRDIKPDNVLLDAETGRPMLTDFGVARARASGATLTQVGAIVGTPHYMSPEQASGERELDGRSDLYSLGVMGYQMVAGRLPFDGESLRDVIVQHVTQEPPSLSAVAPQAPTGLALAIMRCLAKDPAERFADGESLQLAVREAGDETLHLPSPLRVAAQFGWWSLARGLTIAASLGVGGIVARGTVYGQVLYMLAAGFTAIDVGWFLGAGWDARRKGHHASVVAEYQRRPPRGWRFWWPESWRRPGDVWARLPVVARSARTWWTIGIGLFVVMVWAVVASARGAPLVQFTLLTVGLAAAGTATAVFLIATMRAERWARALGLRSDSAEALFVHPTYDPEFWRQSRVAALLESRTSADRVPRGAPETPDELVRAIEAAARSLTGEPRAVVDDAHSAACQVHSLIGMLDKEVGQLARDGDPGELAQVRRRLAALGEPGGDNEARGKMRLLLAGQEELLRGLGERLAAASERRGRLVELLRTLWLRVANLRAAAAETNLDTGEAIGRIRGVLAEIGRQSDAIAMVDVLVNDRPA